jgi:hypothetical protein
VRISRTWGSFDIYPARYGVARYRLVVFPPGITVRERWLLRVWRGWPLWGAALWLGLQIGGALTGMPETALIGGSMIYIAAGAIAFILAGDARLRVHTLWATSIAGDRRPNSRYSALRVMARTLDHADLDREEGRITPLQHEARWWQVYDALGAMAATVSARTSQIPSAISAAASNPAMPRSTNPSGISVHHR